MFGAGYAGAQDRLFLMDVLRHTGRAELASFLGGVQCRSRRQPVGLRAVHGSRPRKADRPVAPALRAEGQQAVEDVDAYVEGINAYVAAANARPLLKPGEYALLGQTMEPWKPTDVIAIASLVGGIFGRGGGNELDSALTMQAFQAASARRPGRKAWLGFRSKNDPEAPTTIARSSPTRPKAPSPSAAWRSPTGRRHRAGDRKDDSAAPARRQGFGDQLSRALARPATPPTGSWSRPRSRPAATRSAVLGRRSATTCRRS